jgi:hypothetical protein
VPSDSRRACRLRLGQPSARLAGASRCRETSRFGMRAEGSRGFRRPRGR